MKRVFLFCLIAIAIGISITPSHTLSAPALATLRTEAVTLTSAQIENLAVTHVPVVAAPGAGKMLVPLSATFQYRFGTTPYSPANQAEPVIGLVWGSSESDVAFGGSQVGFLDQSVNRVMQGGDGPLFIGAAVVDNETAFVDVPLEVAASGDPSGGDGTIVVTVAYTTIAVN